MYTTTMKFKYTAIRIIVLGLFLLMVNTSNALAQSIPRATSGTSSTSVNNFKLDVKIKNPLKITTVQEAVALFVNAIVRLSIPVIVIFFLWSGLSFILARGNPEGIKKAKNMFFYTIIGTLLILGAWTITNAIIGTVNTLAS